MPQQAHYQLFNHRHEDLVREVDFSEFVTLHHKGSIVSLLKLRLRFTLFGAGVPLLTLWTAQISMERAWPLRARIRESRSTTRRRKVGNGSCAIRGEPMMRRLIV
jgi:hypothetical protein